MYFCHWQICIYLYETSNEIKVQQLLKSWQCLLSLGIGWNAVPFVEHKANKMKDRALSTSSQLLYHLMFFKDNNIFTITDIQNRKHPIWYLLCIRTHPQKCVKPRNTTLLREISSDISTHVVWSEICFWDDYWLKWFRKKTCNFIISTVPDDCLALFHGRPSVGTV